MDTGAAYTTLPGGLLRGLGIEPVGKRRFLLADGRRIEMDYGEARATVDGESVTTLVVFGEDNAPALLGAYTLEGLALAVDPAGRTATSCFMFPVPASDHVPLGRFGHSGSRPSPLK